MASADMGVSLAREEGIWTSFRACWLSLTEFYYYWLSVFRCELSANTHSIAALLWGDVRKPWSCKCCG